MMSLRRRLLLSLCAAVAFVGGISALVAYRQVNHETKELLDNQLQQIAAIVAAQDVSTPRPMRSDDSDIEVGIWTADGKLQFSSSPLVSAPHTTAAGFAEKLLGTEPYRIYTAMLGGRHIEIAQPVDTRDDQAEAAALAAFLPVFVLLPVSAILIALVIRALLQPVKDLAAAVSRRDTFAREALLSHSLPSEVRPLVDEINRLLERQSEAAQRERYFVADAAHALRTPLAALQLQADVLDGSRDPAERAARLSELRAGIQRAARLSEQLLSLARIESDIHANGHAVDINGTLQEVIGLYQSAAASNKIALRIDGHCNATVRGDQRRLLLICTNLLDNALNHTPAGGCIELRVSADHAAAHIEIRDEGPGLEADQLARVFERFYRAPDSQGAGSGLGLATVESLVKQLGGSVSLQNRTDRSGLIARVNLPIAQEQAGP